MPIVRIYAVIYRAVIRHHEGALETERYEHSGAYDIQLFGNRLVLPPLRVLIINQGFLLSAIIRAGTNRIYKLPTVIDSCESIDHSRHMVV